VSATPKIRLSRLRDIGWSLWDPIGLLPDGQRWDDPGNTGFADEYDGYLIFAAGQLKRGLAKAEVASYLVGIATDHMGLGPQPDGKSRAEAVVEAILADGQLWSEGDEPQAWLHVE
jgi:hypothetical protein